MHTKGTITEGIAALGIKPNDTLLVHSSMKSLGEVQGGADTVLDAFIEYMQPGLLILPTHTWKQMNSEYPIFDPLTEPSCVGLMTNLFMKRPNVIRSWHPTHSVAALGNDAESYVAGDEQWDTPCSPKGCWGKLYVRKAKILFLGCSMNKNTFLHSVEEWNNISNRLSEDTLKLQVRMPNGKIMSRPVHYHKAPIEDISSNYGKMKAPFIKEGIAIEGYIGDANCVLADAVGMAELTTEYLKRNPDLFLNDSFE